MAPTRMVATCCRPSAGPSVTTLSQDALFDIRGNDSLDQRGKMRRFGRQKLAIDYVRLPRPYTTSNYFG